MKKENYELYVYSCPVSIPFNFARHTWIVFRKNDKITRYDLMYNVFSKINNNLIKKNFQSPFKGFQVFMINKNPAKGWCFNGRMEYKLSGIKAKKAINLIEKNVKLYPFKKEYNIFGPNSNTFTQWLINKTNLKIKLPWNALGKSYNKY